MPERRELTGDEWTAIRERWEGAHDAADAGFKWVALEAREAFGAELAPKAVERRASAEGWLKRPDRPSGPLASGPAQAAATTARRRRAQPTDEPDRAPPPTRAFPVALLPGTKPPGYKGTGRPSAYRDEYVAMLDAFFDVEVQTLVERTEFGVKVIRVPPRFPTFERFACDLGVTAQVLQDWGRAHPEFEAARLRAKGMQIALLIEGGLGGHFNANVANFALRNLAGWRDKPEETVDAAAVNAEELDRLYADVMRQSHERAERLRAERAAFRERMRNASHTTPSHSAEADGGTAG